MRFRIAVFCGLGAAVRLSEGAGDYASRVASARGDTESAFELLDTLLATGERQRPDQPLAVIDGNIRPHVNGNGRHLMADRPPVLNGNESPANGVSEGDPLADDGVRDSGLLQDREPV